MILFLYAIGYAIARDRDRVASRVATRRVRPDAIARRFLRRFYNRIRTIANPDRESHRVRPDAIARRFLRRFYNLIIVSVRSQIRIVNRIASGLGLGF